MGVAKVTELMLIRNTKNANKFIVRVWYLHCRVRVLDEVCDNVQIRSMGREDRLGQANAFAY
jgi:hypothetical protein